MSFEAPIWLYLTPLLLLLFGAVVIYGFQQRDALLGRFAASRLLNQLTEQASRPRTWIKAACVLLAVAAIAIALARPQYGVEWSERKARGLDIVFVLDSSKSMLATDLRPTRLDRAKLAIIDLVERLESDRIGLVAFAGQAFLQTPPTLDYSAFRESLEAVDPGIMTSGGSDLGTALKEASEAFPSENNVKVVVLLTDGEDLGGQAIEAARAAGSEGIQVFAIGIGTTEGEYLKIRNEEGIEEFVRNADGQPVLSQLDEATLQQIAQFTGGSYSRLSSESLDQLYTNVIATLPREERESELQEIRVERFQWLLSAALIFLVLETLIRRRRSASIQASALLIAVLALHPSEARAQAETPINVTMEAEANISTDARSLYNRAYETLHAGDYEAATELYERALSNTQDLKLQADALYNMGHVAYQQGRSLYESGDPQAALEQMKRAEQRFQAAQEIAPDDRSIEEDLKQIRQVREAIEKFLEQQKQQQDQQQDSSDQEQQDQEQASDQSGDSQEQDSQQSDDTQESQPNQDESQQGHQQDQQGQQSPDSSDPSDQDQQGQQGEQDDQDPQGQQPQDSPQDPSRQPGQPDQNQQETDPGDSSQGTPQESTEDPVDDIPQPQAGEESEEPSAQNQEQTNIPEPGEGDAAEGQSDAGSLSGEAVGGMTEAEAAALLDSLRGKETLLPFIDSQRSGRNRDIRDW
jgi:Ca-activated chloride channel family protein